MSKTNKEDQIQELDNWIKKPRDGREYQRVLAVKLALQGWRYEIIASSLNLSKSFISKWKKRFENDGIDGLKLGYQGGNSYLSKSERKSVIAWLQEQEYWDLSELECYLIENYDVIFQSPTSYYSLLSEAKVSWQKAQKKNPRQNPEKVKQRSEEIQSYLRELKPEIDAGQVVVYAIDEVHLLEGDLIGQGWGDRKKRLKIPIENEKKSSDLLWSFRLNEIGFNCERLCRWKWRFNCGFFARTNLSKFGQKNRDMVGWCTLP